MPLLNKTHQKNLEILAKELPNVSNFVIFNLNNYLSVVNKDIKSDFIDTSFIELVKSYRILVHADLIGHCAFIPQFKNTFLDLDRCNWECVSSALFGVESNEALWCYLFHPIWARYDNSLNSAVSRINTVLSNIDNEKATFEDFWYDLCPFYNQND